MSGELRLREGVSWREVDGQVIALDVTGGRYLSTNASASALWPLVAAGTTRERLEVELVAAYGIDEERARRDVATWVGWLESERLVRTGA